MITIQQAEIQDHLELTDVMRKSKAYWGYSKEQLQLWEKELTIDQAHLQAYEVYKAVDNSKIIGFYSYIISANDTVELENLFVIPTYISRGCGKILMYDLFEKVGREEVSKITLEADPHAEGFYRYFGFEVVGKKESSVENRFLPVMLKHIQTP